MAPRVAANSVSKPGTVNVKPVSLTGRNTPAATIGLKTTSSNSGQSIFDQLVNAYREGQPDQWTKAEAAIHQAGETVLPTLLNGLKSSDIQTRELASMMLAQVLPNLLFTENPSQQLELGSLKESLRLALADDSVEVRVNVAVALSLMEGEGPKLVPVFHQLLASELPHVRTMAVVALGGLGRSASSAIPAMEVLSQTDPSEEVKSAAHEALRMLRSTP